MVVRVLAAVGLTVLLSGCLSSGGWGPSDAHLVLNLHGGKAFADAYSSATLTVTSILLHPSTGGIWWKDTDLANATGSVLVLTPDGFGGAMGLDLPHGSYDTIELEVTLQAVAKNGASVQQVNLGEVERDLLLTAGGQQSTNVTFMRQGGAEAPHFVLMA